MLQLPTGREANACGAGILPTESLAEQLKYLKPRRFHATKRNTRERGTSIRPVREEDLLARSMVSTLDGSPRVKKRGVYIFYTSDTYISLRLCLRIY